MNITNGNAMIKLGNQPNVVLLLGFDCDRPRDAFIYSKEGSEMAERKLNSITQISNVLNELKLPRTFFVCGHFLKSMNYKYDSKKLKQSFDVDNKLVEIADHSYSHNVLKSITTRPDKIPMTPEKVFEEYQLNTKIFDEIFGMSDYHRGYRTPLGHYNGLTGMNNLLEKMKQVGVKYISSDLRGSNDSINEPLTNLDGTNILKVVYSYYKSKKRKDFYLLDLAYYYKRKPEKLESGIINLWRNGFISYDPSTGMINVLSKLRHYFLSHLKKSDYDEMYFESLSEASSNLIYNLPLNQMYFEFVLMN